MKKRPFRTLTIVIGALVVLLLIVWAALPLVVTSAPVRSAITSRMSTLLDQDVELAGDLSLTLFPRPVARLGRIIVPGTGSQPLLTVETLDAELALASLFLGRPEVSAMHFVRPVLHLPLGEAGLLAPFGQVARAVELRRAAGVSPVTETAGAETPKAFTLPDGFPAAIGRITVEGGQISLGLEDDGEANQITAVNGTVGIRQT